MNIDYHQSQLIDTQSEHSEQDSEENDSLDWLFEKIWRDKYGDVTRDELSRLICAEKSIKNDTQEYEENLSWRVVDFGLNFPVFCRGRLNGEYKVVRIHILAATNHRLSGPHYIQIEDNEPFWVHSLTALRKKFFGFDDFVSFERSAFITCEFNNFTAIRLKMIRQIIKAPIKEPDYVYTDVNKAYNYFPNHTKRNERKLTLRSTSQIQRLIFSIKQIYYRDGITPPNEINL